jgi:adenosylcobinamide-GDP ribazoletransferase
VRDALAFLTVLPAGCRTRPPGRAAIAAFPLVGLLVGILWWGAGRGGTRLWGPPVGAALVLVADLLVTGGLHLDGLADEADGVACRLPPGEAVAVMRQGPVGAIGASAAAILLLVRFALLSTVFADAAGSHAAALIAVPAAGRFAMVWTMARTRRRPTDRVSHGPSLASEVREAARGLPLAVSGAVALASVCLLAGPRGLIGVVCACLVASANAAFAARRFGAVTGDVVGAGGLLGETAMLAAVAAHL